MKIFFDVSTLDPDKITGVGVYMLQLLRQSALETENILKPVVKLSRWSRLSRIARDLPQKKCTVYPPWGHLFGHADFIFHGPDFKIPTFRCQKIVTIHDMIVFEKKYNEPRFYEKGMAQLTKTIESSPTAILVNSDFTRNEILKHFPNLRTPILRTHLGCDRLSYGSEMTLSLPEKYILYVGNFEKRKNILGLLNAYSLFREKGGRSSLVLSGRRGFGSGEIQRALDESRYKKDIVHFQYVPAAALGELYARAETFFFPSFYEGFGIPILEAMASGVPVLTSSGGGTEEVAGDVALLADPHDIEGMAEKLILYERNPDLRDEKSRLGLERAQNFSWKKCWNETKLVYQKIQEGSL